MIKILVKKQLMEVFKGYFYDAKKNKARSKISIAAWILFFVVIMVGVLGGSFTAMSLSLCGGLTQANAGWLYFALMAGVAILLGAFGSVFNTYAGLYLSKDNDLLLSMPIPVNKIIAARLVNVFIMGAMYSSVAIIPALIVYWIVADCSAAAVICGIIFALIISIIVLILSCLLGWLVAKISLKVRNKSIVSALASLVIIVLYYVGYFKAANMIRDMIANAAVYSEKIKGAAHWIYTFGRIGEGDWAATGVWAVISAAVLVVTWRVLSRSFLSIATANGTSKKKVYVEKTVKENSAFKALLNKEFAKFTSSANYMLNCGFGVLLMLVAAVGIFWKGPAAIDALNEVFDPSRDYACALFLAVLMFLASSNNMSAPSVSLEGKSIWIPQSLPVGARTVLRAKATAHLLVQAIPMLLATISTVIILKESAAVTAMVVLVSVAFTVFSVVLASFLGIKMPNLQWTSEIVPIKQGGAVSISLFGCWCVTIAFCVLFMLAGYKLGLVVYLAIWTAIFAAASYVMMHWIDTKGAEKFAYLQ